MTLWFILALMTVAAIFAVEWPLGRQVKLRSGSDIAVYRAQLDEIETDRAAGRIAENEAQPATPRADRKRPRRDRELHAEAGRRRAQKAGSLETKSRVTGKTTTARRNNGFRFI